MKAIGLFGGAFSPFHTGHLRLAIEARERLGLDQVRLVPTARPVHRETSGVAAQRRFEWVQLAVEGERGLVADDCELRRETPSYTVDTLETLAEQFPRARRVLLMGADAFSHFHTWHRWPRILELARIAVAQRPGTRVRPPPEAAEALRGRWQSLELPLLDISSTRVRQRLRDGLSVRGLVPDAILDSFSAADLAALTEDENASTH